MVVSTNSGGSSTEHISHVSQVSYVPYSTVPSGKPLSSTITFSPFLASSTTANFLSFSFLSDSSDSNFFLVSFSFTFSSFTPSFPSVFSVSLLAAAPEPLDSFFSQDFFDASVSSNAMKFSIALKISSFFFSGIFSKSFTAAFVSSSKRFSSSFERCSEFFSFFSEDFCSRLSIASRFSSSPIFARCSHLSTHPDFVSNRSFRPIEFPRFLRNSLWCLCHFDMVSAGTTGGFSARAIWMPFPSFPSTQKTTYTTHAKEKKTVCERAKKTPHIGPRPSRTL
mmetsp:Transcript_9979/g.28759  ORF Transcript_9979/g.28759 Transcript_9979/m.28759 type:complete len:280 (-) Transcript_9979:60-899(-)